MSRQDENKEIVVCLSCQQKNWVIPSLLTRTNCGKCRKPLSEAKQTEPEGFVYLLKAGPFYKIGKAVDLDKRLRRIKLQLPYPVELVHSIEARNPRKIEHHWHKRFADKRTNGEWFLLTDEDVAEFKKWKKMWLKVS
jgi:Meiotically up-regulated gene 113